MKVLRTSLIRFIIQFSFVAFLLYAAILHKIKGGGPTGSASVDALCPFGGLEGLYKYITTGQLMDRIQISSLILLVSLVLLVLFTSKAFCGWICPFGTIQEWFGRLGNKIMGKRLVVPEKVDKSLRYLKYIVLLLVLVLTWIGGTLIFRSYDPWVAVMHLGEGTEIFNDFLVAVIVLGIVIIGSFLVDRFWCKYLCPLGAFMNIFSRVGLLKVHRDKDACINCSICNKDCQMNIKVNESEVINNAECINCLKCSSACPRNDVIKMKANWFESKRLISATAFAAIILAVFFGVYLTTRVTGVWNATGSLPNVAADSKINPDEIKGYMTIKDVANYMKMDKNELYEKLKIPNNIPEDTKLKDVSKFIEGFSPDEAREILKR